MNIELTLTSVVLATLYYALYLSSGFVSISLCKKYSSIKKYFSKQYAPTYLIGLFIFVYVIIPTGVIIFTVLNTIRVYAQYVWLN